jgi:hypothetical protein
MKTLPIAKMTRFALTVLIITGLGPPRMLLRGQGAAQGAVQLVRIRKELVAHV